MASSLFTVALVAMLVAGYNCSDFSCKRLKDRYPLTPSGVYEMETRSGRDFKVYCEMGLNHGGYTFLNPADLSLLTNADLQAMITDKSSVLFRVRMTNGAQPYATLRQLPEYSSIPLKLGISNFDGYSGPLNQNVLGNLFLFLGFLPRSHAANRNVQGIQVNAYRNYFRNCDSNPNSLITLFPNFWQIAPSTYHVPGPFCSNIFNHLLPNPFGRAMPVEYFMFGEMHFGGCGCYLQSNRIPGVLGWSIGFR
jgi:hypothetical protein